MKPTRPGCIPRLAGDLLIRHRIYKHAHIWYTSDHPQWFPQSCVCVCTSRVGWPLCYKGCGTIISPREFTNPRLGLRRGRLLMQGGWFIYPKVGLCGYKGPGARIHGCNPLEVGKRFVCLGTRLSCRESFDSMKKNTGVEIALENWGCWRILSLFEILKQSYCISLYVWLVCVCKGVVQFLAICIMPSAAFVWHSATQRQSYVRTA